MTSKTLSFKGKSYTAEALNDMSLSALAELYNAIIISLGSDKTISKFSDKVSAVRRTFQALEDVDAQEMAARKNRPVQAPAAPEKPKKERPARKTSGGSAMARPIILPGGGELSVPRDIDSLRHRCMTMLLKTKDEAGNTVSHTRKDVYKLVEKFDRERGKEPFNVERRSYELIRLMHYAVGYGVREDAETGAIKLHQGK